MSELCRQPGLRRSVVVPLGNRRTLVCPQSTIPPPGFPRTPVSRACVSLNRYLGPQTSPQDSISCSICGCGASPLGGLPSTQVHTYSITLVHTHSWELFSPQAITCLFGGFPHSHPWLWHGRLRVPSTRGVYSFSVLAA